MPGPARTFSLLEERFPEAEALALACHRAGYGLKELGSSETRDHYYDDAEGRLRKRGLWLRRHGWGDGVTAVLEREDSADALALEAGSEGWPSAILRRLGQVCDPNGLQGQLELQTESQDYELAREATPLARLSLIRVEARYPGSDQSVSFNEAELRPFEGTEAELDGIADLLHGLLALTPNPAPRLVRVEALLGLGAGFHHG